MMDSRTGEFTALSNLAELEALRSKDAVFMAGEMDAIERISDAVKAAHKKARKAQKKARRANRK